MSILIKGSNGSSVGGSSKGFPPGDVNIFEYKPGNKCVLLKFSDPDDSIYNNTTLSTWYSTIIVRKEGSAPTSIKDGVIVLENTERNKYKDEYFTDSNIELNKTYYYRFYTMSTDKIYNDSTNMIFSITVKEYYENLKENSWDKIVEASESGVASSIWNIGDEIDITLSGTFNETVTLQIWDFNHFDKSDGSGKAGICFGMKNLMKNTQVITPNSHSNYQGWDATTMKKTTVGQILSSMPSNLRSYIKEVNTYASKGNSYTGTGVLSKDKVFLPGCIEVLGKSSNTELQYSVESNQFQFPIFTDNSFITKKLSNGSGSANYWWTRSPAANDDYHFVFIANELGKSEMNPQYDAGICFCFNV